jgi:hypothetical protein
MADCRLNRTRQLNFQLSKMDKCLFMYFLMQRGNPELERRAPSPDPVTAMVQKNIRERNEAARKWSAARQEARLARAKAILDKNCGRSGR